MEKDKGRSDFCLVPRSLRKKKVRPYSLEEDPRFKLLDLNKERKKLERQEYGVKGEIVFFPRKPGPIDCG